ncbi:MAG: hypothetical protein AAF198_09515 [Pseudomonadota bacterium]
MTQITEKPVGMVHLEGEKSVHGGAEMTQSVVNSEMFQDKINRLLISIRTRPEGTDALISSMKSDTKLLLMAISDRLDADRIADLAPYEAWSDQMICTLDYAHTLSRIGQAAQQQNTLDFLAGAWVQLAKNAKPLADGFVILHGLSIGAKSSGWGTGFAAKMSAVWNFIEAFQILNQAQFRMIEFQTVAFGDATALTAALQGRYPNDIPTNGALKAALLMQSERLATAQIAFDRHSQEIEKQQKNLELAAKDQVANPNLTPGMRRERPGDRL